MATASAPTGGRRALQWTLGLLALIPAASGLGGMFVGPSTLPEDHSTVEASLDSEYRFTNAFWFAVAPAIWAALPRIERNGAPLRALLGVIFVGGIARLVSWRRSGRPHPVFVGAIALELLGMPALALWHRRVESRAQSAPT